MARHLRRHLLALACLAAAGIVATAAVLDHHTKQGRQNRAEAAAWYCAHVGMHCGGASSSRIETRWNHREVGYEVAVSALGAAGAGLLAAGSFRRRGTRAVTRRPA